MASPHVTGIVALLIATEAARRATPAPARGGAPRADRPDLGPPGFDDRYGCGLVNAAAANAAARLALRYVVRMIITLQGA